MTRPANPPQPQPAYAALLLFLLLLCNGSHAPLSAAEDGLLQHWLLDPAHIDRQTLSDASGQLTAALSGTIAAPDTESLSFNGRNASILITQRLESVPLPKRGMTVEAWVAIDKPQPWGGILSCLQDNGDYERGWLLGFIDSKFSFALASTGAQRLTYAKSTTSFKPGQWYHVAGTYDGSRQTVFVNGQPETVEAAQSGDLLYPPRTFYEIGAYHDDNEQYNIAGKIHEIRVYDRALSPEELRAHYNAKRHRFPEPPEPFRLALGPFVEWIDRDSVELSWETFEPTSSSLAFGLKSTPPREYTRPEPVTRHSVTIDGIRPDSLYTYRIKRLHENQPDAVSPTYEFDSTFYYLPIPAPETASPFPVDRFTRLYEETAERILRDSGVTDGYCLILGAGQGRLAYELVRRSDLYVVAIDEDAATVQAARKALDAAGLYGVRATVHHGRFDQLPYGPFFANLIVSDALLRQGQLPGAAADLLYCLRPSGGVALLGQPVATRGSGFNEARVRAWFAAAGVTDLDISTNDGLWARFERPPLDGGGSWSHQYGGPDNAACSQDALVSGAMQILWWGEPGPRPMPDRGNRNPAPLSVNGHLFIQGNRMLFGLDSYNGTVLWAKSTPETRRANMPRDCSNMTASPDHLYVAEGQFCYALQARSGAQDLQFRVPDVDSPQSAVWGYLASVDDLLLGTSGRPGQIYLGDDGEWYEDFQADQIAKVTSDQFFAFDRHTADRIWTYANGAIINSTITIGDDVVYFVESRNPAATTPSAVRLVDELAEDQVLVALDLRTGRVLWERAHDFSKCEFTLYLSYANQTLIAMGADRNKAYHVYAIDTRPAPPPAPDGTPSIDSIGSIRWEQHFQAARDHHSGHLQRPVIVQDTLYTDKRAFDLATGTLLREDLPERRGCGTMSASLNSFFYRHHFHGMWDLKTDERIQFEGIRSGCWLSLITAGGLLLGPETSSGCSCTHAIQTSVAYVPVALAKPTTALRAP